ncbi:hypothetical protein [Streptomyces sp. CoH17]|uniref:hypothetical protein n=1 Tax=Streptomyces sp. CoH17 TaxID=2992806 RepID=UPI00226DDB57|nr:hypothetical protein [Streptomyces sp. CoH17]
MPEDQLQVSVHEIVERTAVWWTCLYSHVHPADIVGKAAEFGPGSGGGVSTARMAAIWACRKLTSYSYAQLGVFFGRSDRFISQAYSKMKSRGYPELYDLDYLLEFIAYKYKKQLEDQMNSRAA